MSRNTVILAVLMLAATPSYPSRALAGPKEQAAALFRQGIEQMDSKQYGAALATFEEAYRLLPSYKIDYNIALTLEYLGRKAEAAERFERFLVRGRGAAPAENLELARRKLSALSEGLGRLMVPIQEEPAVVAIDGKPRGNAGLPWPFYLEPGSHAVEVTAKGGSPFKTWVSAVAGQERVLEVPAQLIAPPEPTPPPEPVVQPDTPEPGAGEAGEEPALRATEEPPPMPEAALTAPAAEDDENASRRRTKSIVGGTALGLGLACAVGAAILYGVGQSQGSTAYDEYKALTAYDGQDAIDAKWADVESAEDLFIGGHVLVGVAAVAMGIGIWQLATRPDESPAQETAWRRWNAGLSADAGGATVVVGGAF